MTSPESAKEGNSVQSFFPEIPDNIRIIFLDMDHTLINNDCDLSWKQYLAEAGIARLADRLLARWHYWMYRLNRLNQEKFLRFQLLQFAGRSPEEMEPLLEAHFAKKVKPAIYPQTFSLLEYLQKKSLHPVLLTATNEAVAKPLARHLHIPELQATRLEIQHGLYTGKIIPPYCWGEGKIYYMQKSCEQQGCTLDESGYWGDSVTDIPAMEATAFPVAVNPAPLLLAHARKKGWPVLNLMG